MPEPTLLNDEIRDMLMDCGLFDPLLPEDFHIAAGYFNISSIAQDEVIFLEGDAGTFMCILHSGQVSVQKANHHGQRLTIAPCAVAGRLVKWPYSMASGVPPAVWRPVIACC